MASKAERCETCRYWKRGTKPESYDGSGVPSENTVEAPWGDCRRYAPRGAVVIPESASSGCISGEVAPWATTDYSDWCGEYQPQETRT